MHISVHTAKSLAAVPMAIVSSNVLFAAAIADDDLVKNSTIFSLLSACEFPIALILLAMPSSASLASILNLCIYRSRKLRLKTVYIYIFIFSNMYLSISIDLLSKS